MIAPEEEDESSKTEEPSERKISKAKEEGDVAISQDAKSFIMLLGMLFVVWLLLPLMFKWFYYLGIKFIENAGQIEVTPGNFLLIFKSSQLLFTLFRSQFQILGIIRLIIINSAKRNFDSTRSYRIEEGFIVTDEQEGT